MTINNMKSVTVYDKLNRKHTLKAGETWMHGSLGVVTVDEIYRRNHKICTTTVLYTDKKGTKWSTTASDMGAGDWQLHSNFLFKIA